MTKLNDLENIVVLKSDTYDCGGSNYTNVEQPRFLTTFENQSTYGQRYHSKPFDQAQETQKAQDYYEKRPILSDDGEVMNEELGEPNQTFYHHQFPTSDNKPETFITHPYDTPQNAEDVWSSGFIPISGPTIPETIEEFANKERKVKPATKEAFESSSSAVIIAIIIMIILIVIPLFIFYKRRQQFNSIKENFAQGFKNLVGKKAETKVEPIEDEEPEIETVAIVSKPEVKGKTVEFKPAEASEGDAIQGGSDRLFNFELNKIAKTSKGKKATKTAKGKKTAKKSGKSKVKHAVDKPFNFNIK